jgi:hypothetical protein
MNPPQPPLPDRDQLKLLLEQVEGRLGTQREEWDGLDRKATTILGATGVLFGLVVNNADPLATTPQPGPRLFLASLVVLIGGVVVGILCLAPRRIANVPEPTPLVRGYASATTDLTLGTLTTTKAQVFDFNRSVLESKLRFLVVQMALLVIGGALLTAALVIGEVTL